MAYAELYLLINVFVIFTLLMLAYGDIVSKVSKTVFGYVVAVGYFLFFIPFALAIGAVLVPICLLKQLCVAVYNIIMFGIELSILLWKEYEL